jgi:hypothetical protein
VAPVGSEADPRVEAAQEAIAFWNRTFAELGSPFRPGPVPRVDDQVPAQDMELLSQKTLGSRG